MKYIIPGYVEIERNGERTLVTSNLLKNKIKLTDFSIRQEFDDIVKAGGRDEISTDLTRLLYEQEMLQTRQEIDKIVCSLKERMNKSLLLTIMPTEACNFRCPYCYEPHENITMTSDIVEQIKKYIQNMIDKFDNLQISWFGGEPTLCENIILDISSCVKELQTVRKFNYAATMTTNGYLLNIEMFIKFYEVGIRSFQITLDGWNHNEIRPHISGIRTLERIIDNLRKISTLSSEYEYNIIIRHNILDGDQDFSWYDYLSSLFAKDKRFSILVALVSDWGGTLVGSMPISEGKNRKQLKYAHQAYIKKIGLTLYEQPNDLFSDICYASFPYGFVFRANGMIDKCTISLNAPENHIGRIDAMEGIIIDPKKSKAWTEGQIHQKCYGCNRVLNCLNISCKKGAVVDNMCEKYVCKTFYPNKS